MKYWYLACGVLCAGCAFVGLKYMMPLEKERAQDQQKRASNIKQLVDTASSALPEDADPNVRGSLQVIAQEAEAVGGEAVKSERWHTAGEKIVGPPPATMKAGSDEETAVLAQTEQEAETLGKVRKGLQALPQSLPGKAAGGGGGLAGLLGLLGGPTGAAGVLLVLKRMKQQKEETDERQDKAFQAFQAAMMSEIQQLQDSIRELKKG